MRTKLLWFSKALIYATFVVPIVVAPTSFIFPFIVPKVLLFRGLVTVLCASYALLLVLNWEEFKPRATPVTIVLSLFLLSFGLSTFIGSDWYHSFWDNHERMLGLFTLVHYVAYYYALSGIFTTWADWKMALRLFLIAGSVVMVLGMLQVANPDFLMNQGSNRVASTLGNPIYVGGYGMFLAFVAYLLFIKDKNIVWRVVEVVLGVCGVLGMFFSGTRGSMLGLAAGLFIIIVGYSIALREHPRVRQALWGSLAIGMILLAILYAYRQTDTVKNIPAIGRTLNTSMQEITNSPRWIAWHIAAESWAEKPVFGWGPNNFFYAFNKYYNPKSLEFGYNETWFDNAHNIIMNTLAVQGAFGIITYLALFVVSWVYIIRAYRQKRLDVHLAVVLAAFMFAHLVENITVFENPTSYLSFMFWLALINWATNQTPAPAADAIKNNKNKIAEPAAPKNINAGVVIATFLVAALFVFVFEIQPARANSRTLLALQLLGSDPTAGVEAAREALAFSSPHIDDIRNDLARSAAPLMSGNNIPGFDDAKRAEVFNLMYGELQKNHILHPLDIRIQLTLAQLAQMYAIQTNNISYMYDVEKFLADAHQLSPKRQQVLYGLAGVKMQLGKTDEGINLFEQSITDNPKIIEGYWRLAYAYKMLGRPADATNMLVRLQNAGLTLTPEQQQTLDQANPPATPTSPPKAKTKK